jgi:hypothetical protein
MKRPLASALLCSALLGATPAGTARQGQAFLDQGTFVIAREGDEIGREEFAIRPVAGSADGFLAVATVRYQGRELKAALELGAGRAPASYQLDVTTGGRVTERLTGQFGPGRFAVRIATPAREVAREFPVPPSAVVLDDDIFDQYYFIPHGAGAPPSVAVVRPRETRLVTARVSDLGSDTVVVAGRRAPADHLAVTLPPDDRREVWFSPAGTLLKVALPTSGITATRLTLPPR